MATTASTAFEGPSRPSVTVACRQRRATRLINKPLPVRWDDIAAGMAYYLVRGISTIPELFSDLQAFVPILHCERPGAAYLVKAVFDALLSIDAAKAIDYITGISDLSVREFYRYWNVCTFHRPLGVRSIDYDKYPLQAKFSGTGVSNTIYNLYDIGPAGCAYIGGIVAHGYICYWKYKEMVLYLIDKFQEREDIRCITTLVQNTTTGEVYHKDIPFILECLSRLRKRAQTLFSDIAAGEVCYSYLTACHALLIIFLCYCFIQEETELSTLLQSMLLGKAIESLPWALTYLPTEVARGRKYEQNC